MINVETIFAKNVFTLGKMKDYLPAEVFLDVKKVIDQGGEFTTCEADIIAKAMKDWAMENGATHYSHWFQPLTGVTAEKHDSFITHPDEDGNMIMDFSGRELIKGEPDASAFPSGGLRATFEARGYTAWDITSPAFLKETAAGVFLCIPTAFCSYTGEALDKKTPLLRSMEAINTEALRIIRLFGDKTSTKVTPMVGPEQEYFLVDAAKYLERRDLVFTGRTLYGAPAPKGHEMDDHYYGDIRERVGAFMRDLNEELWKMGVTARTQHNESAPAQHELAPIYETANIAVDHNQIVMETMKRVAVRHDLRCLLHEKPFAGVSGSGKHNNWSLSTDTGLNLLDPGETPNENIQFLLIVACIMKAVDTHADLLRQSAADVGNDHRLGAYEAPPAIISIFLGEQLEDVVRQMVETGTADSLIESGKVKTGVSTLPDLIKDTTDRNRTSPFAFTGTKFEFRMTGSSDSVASPNTTLNAIVAEAFCEAADILEKATDVDLAIHNLIKEYMIKHQRIIFNGDSYSPDWVKEAEKRGLPNISTMVEAIEALTTDKAVALYEKFNIFTRPELVATQAILYDRYSKTIKIEAKTMIDMASKQIIPAVIRYTSELAFAINQVKETGVSTIVQSKILGAVTEQLIKMQTTLDKLKELEETAAAIPDYRERAFYYKDKIRVAMEELRSPADELEKLVDTEYWPFPTYGDLMFEV